MPSTSGFHKASGSRQWIAKKRSDQSKDPCVENSADQSYFEKPENEHTSATPNNFKGKGGAKGSDKGTASSSAREARVKARRDRLAAELELEAGTACRDHQYSEETQRSEQSERSGGVQRRQRKNKEKGTGKGEVQIDECCTIASQENAQQNTSTLAQVDPAQPHSVSTQTRDRRIHNNTQQQQSEDRSYQRPNQSQQSWWQQPEPSWRYSYLNGWHQAWHYSPQAWDHMQEYNDSHWRHAEQYHHQHNHHNGQHLHDPPRQQRNVQQPQQQLQGQLEQVPAQNRLSMQRTLTEEGRVEAHQPVAQNHGLQREPNASQQLSDATNSEAASRPSSLVQQAVRQRNLALSSSFVDRALSSQTLSRPAVALESDPPVVQQTLTEEEFAVDLHAEIHLEKHSWLDNTSSVADLLSEYEECKRRDAEEAERETSDVVEDWEDIVQDDDGGRGEHMPSARCQDDLLPWYNPAFLLYCRTANLDVSSECALAIMKPRPKPKPPPPRIPSLNLVSLVRDVSGEGMALALSPQAAAASGYGTIFTGSSAATGYWEQIEQLPWTLLQPAGPPSWSQDRGGATVRWRVHVVDAKAKPDNFFAGPRNSCCLWEGAGGWQKQVLRPGIMNVEVALERGLPLHVCTAPIRPSSPANSLACLETCYEVRSVVLANTVSFCLEHRRPEVGLHCLCPEALADAAAPGMPAASEVAIWDSTADYMAGWRAAVELEGAASAADEGDTRLLCNVEIVWGSGGRGSFVIPSGLATAHRMKLRGLVRGDDGPTEWASAWLCIQQPPSNSSSGAGWSGHAGVVDVELVSDDGGAQPLAVNVGEEDVQIPQSQGLRISFQLVTGASETPPKNGQKRAGYLIEFIPKSLPYSCMAVAMAELSYASELLTAVMLTAKPPATVQHRRVSDDDSWHVEVKDGTSKKPAFDLGPWQLNHPQEAAVQASLELQLSLIHGPPGTGKTTTAAALCILFALSNLDAGEVAAVLYCTPSNDAADVACLRVAQTSSKHFQELATRRRREALASGVSDDCSICFGGGCDCITACGHQFHKACLEKAIEAGNKRCPLCRRPLRQPEGGLTALRVYSAEMERTDFPVPKRIDHPSAKPRKPRTVPESMRPHALHWRCHGLAPGVEPTKEALLAGEAYRQLLQAGLGSPYFDELRAEYYLALSAARVSEIRRADVVFATCISARRGGLAAALQADGAPDLRQVVLDEAGQAPEPEALCPLTLAKNTKKIVLVGDPKQLRPIITSPAAERLGLNISLLERLSDAPGARPRLLSLQYRMHKDLNAFPASYFYGGQVRTDPAVLQRPPGLLAHPSRPSKAASLLMWESSGEPAEQISQVRTAASSAKSRFNIAEATRAASLARELAAKAGANRVAVLTWYNAQVAQINDLVQGLGVYVGGVVSSQGNEWDYVILSTVRSSPGGLGALEDEHLLNVALTRARLGMCVLGTPATLRRIGAWAYFLDHCKEQGAMTTSQPVVGPP